MSENRTAGWALAMVTAACVLMTLDITIVNVALPTIRDEMQADLTALQWAITAYTLAFAALLLTAGSLADTWGRRRVFVTGLAVFTLASAGCAMAPGVLALDVLRAVQGAGGAFAFAPAMAIIAAHYTGPARTRAIAVFGAVTMAAGAVGPLVGGALVDSVGWRSIFGLNVPIGAVVVVLSLARLTPDGPATRTRLDPFGVVTLGAGTSLLVLALLRGQDQGWASAATLLQAGCGLVCLAAFIAAQARPGLHMLDLTLFRSPAFTGAALSAVLVRLVSYGLLSYLVIFLGGVYGLSAFGTGVRLLCLSLPLVVGGISAAALGSRLSPGRITALGFVLCAAGLAGFSLADAAGSWQRLVPGLVVLGLGLGLVATPGMAVAMDAAPEERSGMASALINACMPFGTALGTAAMGALFEYRVQDVLVPQLPVTGAAADAAVDAVVAGGTTALVDPVLVAVARDALAQGLAAVGLAGAVVSVLGVLVGLLLIGGRTTAARATTDAQTGATAG